jgi:hypothetical protein
VCVRIAWALVFVQETNVDKQPRLDGKKFDEGKPKLGLISSSLLWAIASVLTIGEQKYGAHNWRGGMNWSRPYDALQRHLTAWWDGESLDLETGKSHLWHAACELMFLVEYEMKGMGNDDRYKCSKELSQSDINSIIRSAS